jgi:hypothetical protein
MRFRAKVKVIVAALVMIPAVLTQTPASASWCAQYSGAWVAKVAVSPPLSNARQP